MLAIRDLIPEVYNASLKLPSVSDQPHLGTLFFRHDSFGDKLYDFFYRHFDKVVGLAPFTRYDSQKMKIEHPDVMLTVLAERYINMALNDDYFLKEE